MRVHDVDRHLHGVEVEAVPCGDLEHAEVDWRVLVSGEADVADLACLASFHRGVDGTVIGEDPVGVFHADDLVELNEIDRVDAEAAHGLFELLFVCLCVRPSILVMTKTLSRQPLEGLAQADFGDAVVVVPGVVEEGDAAIDGLMDEVNLVLGGVLVFGRGGSRPCRWRRRARR